METLNKVTKKLLANVPKVETSTVMTLGMAFGADLLIKNLPLNDKAKGVLRVVVLTMVLMYRQKMPLGQALLIAAAYIAIVSFLTKLNTKTMGHAAPSVATGPTENTKWRSAGPVHSVTLRGHTYTHTRPDKSGPVELKTDGPTGYLGHENAPFQA